MGQIPGLTNPVSNSNESDPPNCIAMVCKFTKTAFFMALVAVIALSLLPQETFPETDTWDKLNHALAYGVLAVVGGIGFKGWRSLLMVGLGLVVLGAGLELAQSVTPNRDGSMYDTLANFVGVAMGSLATAGTAPFLRDPQRRGKQSTPRGNS